MDGLRIDRVGLVLLDGPSDQDDATRTDRPEDTR
jgi:hypothetical protein